ALFTDAEQLGRDRWQLLGAIAVAMDAVPVVRYRLHPGESVTVPEVPGLSLPLGLVLGTEGGLTGSAPETALRLDVAPPGPTERRAHWATYLPDLPTEDLELVVERH